MTVFHHKIATQWLEKQPSVRVASLWLSGVCLKVANRKKDFLNRARQMAEHYHNPELYKRAEKMVHPSGHHFEGMEEDDRYHYPNDQRAYDFALRHLDRKNPSEVVGLYRDADAFFNSRSGDTKKQYEKDLRELDFDALKQRTPSLANEKDRKSDKEVLHEDDRWRVVVPLSHKSMRGEGTDTKWCVSTENPGHACTYRQKDNLHIFVIDKPKAQGGKEAYGKYALTSKGFEGTADVRNTYDRTGPGHKRSLKKAFPAVAEKMGMPDDIRDQVLKTYEEKYPELDARMREYPREVESQNIYRGLSADILYGNVLDTASPQELRKLSRSEISPDAKALVKLKLSSAPLRAEIDPQSIPKQLLKALPTSKAPSHLTPDQVAKAFEVSPEQAKEALGVVQEALGKPSDRSHASAKKQRKQETSFKRWLDGRYEGIGIQNPNPGLKDPIDPDTLLTYAGNSDYEFQRNAIRIKKQLWDQWWQESEEKRKAEASQLRDQIRAYTPRSVHPDAKVENPENIGPDALVNKDAVVSGDAQVRNNAVVTGNAKISGDARVTGDTEVTGGKISGDAKVSGEARVSGNAKISGGLVEKNATVSGGEISGNAKVKGNAVVTGGEIIGGSVRGNALVSGNAKISGGEMKGKAQVTGGKISGGVVSDDAMVTGGKISGGKVVGEAVVSGGTIWGGEVKGKVQVTGGTISGGEFGGDCKIHGGDWDKKTLSAMRSMPEYKEHFRRDGALISGEWDDVPDDVKKKLEPFGPTGKHPDAKIENPKNIGPGVLVGKDAVISGYAKVRGNAIVTGGVISGGLVENNAQVSGGEISSGGYVLGNAQITGGEISGKTFVTGNAQVTGGTISGGRFGGDCKIRGGDWNRATLSVMEIMPEYEKHFNYEGVLISGEWDDVPEDVKKRIEDFGPTGKHPDAKIENPKNIGPYVLVGKDAEISGDAKVRDNAKVTGGKISGNAQVENNALVSGGEISGDAWVGDNAKVSGGEISSGGRVVGDAVVTGGKVSGGEVYGDAQVSGGEIIGGLVEGNAVVNGGKVSGGYMEGNAQVSGGTISGGYFAGDCRIHGGDWNQATLSVMERIPEYKKHFEDGGLISGEWDDVPEDVKKKLEEENAG